MFVPRMVIKPANICLIFICFLLGCICWMDSLATTSMDVNPARTKKDFVVRQKGILCSNMLHLFFD